MQGEAHSTSADMQKVPLQYQQNGRGPVEEEEESSSCCKPDNGSSRLFNIKTFTANISFILFAEIAMFSFTAASVNTIEKRFGLTATQTGAFRAANFTQIISALALGCFGRRAHKPRLLALTNLGVVIGLYAVALLALLDRDQPTQVVSNMASDIHNIPNVYFNDTGLPSHRSSLSQSLCTLDSLGNQTDSDCSSGGQPHKQGSSQLAFIVLVLAFVLEGLGSAQTVLSNVYIDDNTPKKDTGFYIAIVTSMYAVGPIFGFILAAVCLRLPEDLGGYIEGRVPYGNTKDPAWIGCWWLGYAILASLSLIGTIPMFFFPKHLTKPASKTEELKQQAAPFLVQLKAFPRSFIKLMTNVKFLLLNVVIICIAYIIAGLLMNLPRYMEIHFRLPSYVSSIACAFCSAFAAAVGAIMGGYLMKRLKVALPGLVCMLMSSFAIKLVGTAILLFLACPKVQIIGVTDDGVQPEMPCNSNCSCSTDNFQPICASDGVSYYSPCYAGCRNFDNSTYSGCSCVTPDVSTVSGLCNPGCPVLIPYLVVFALAMLLGSIGNVSGTVLKLRVVDDELTSMSMGVSAAILHLVGFTPGKLLFGRLIDTTCLVWQTSCGKTGNCLHYDIDSFRQLMHGVPLAFEAVALCVLLLLYYCVISEQRKNKTVNNNVIVEEEIKQVETSLLDVRT